MNKQHFKETIEKLVETFERNKDVYRSRQSDFNEAQLREQFLNPMFKALGWDMSNEQGYAEQYKEVVHEDKVYVQGKPKAPDYSFRIGGQRKFFLEAKQPFVKIKSEYDPALQLRRYAWSAHLPISILTDFEEFAVYDATIEPKASDSASTSRIEYFTYDQYLEKWEEIYDLFAKESILKGSFDKYAAKEKKGKQLVDKVFLSELENWREWLAKDLARFNPGLSVGELNSSVQKLIDRIIFLRIAEDRGMERYKTLQDITSNANSYPQLVKYFKKAHEKYNSSLFDFETDTLTPKLTVSDKILDKILSNLYYPISPYEFSVLGVELLGSIYEQFLGKVIRLTDGHNAKVEDKPEVKKAGGVYYTPQYIVEYIVKNTVGELVKDKTPKQVETLKVLDPACGSGSFLIGAYEYLLNWHLDYYSASSEAEKAKLEKNGIIFKLESQNPTSNKNVSWHLTTKEKKRIMLNNIYGVDIDEQAVEVTKLSLALKMLENESQESINIQMRMFTDRILPDLSSNIKCGNSLVGSDYWDGKDLSSVSEAEIKKVNAFDWEVEFKDILHGGGFDAVIGNPPYVRVQFLEHKIIDYLKSNYKIAWRRIDISILFFEAGLRLLKKIGKLGFITSNQFEIAEYGRKLRDVLGSKKYLKRTVNYGSLPIFDGASTYVSIYLLSKIENEYFDFYAPKNIEEAESTSTYEYSIVDSSNLNNYSWIIKNNEENKALAKIMGNRAQLRDIGACHYGIISGNDKVLLFDRSEIEHIDIEKEMLLPVMRAQDIGRYKTTHASKYVLYPYIDNGNSTDLISLNQLSVEYPKLYSYLQSNKMILQSRKDSRKNLKDSDQWYGLTRFGKYEIFKKEKILTPGEVKKNRFGISSKICGYSGARVFAITLKNNIFIKPLTAILNSKLIEFYLHTVCPLKQGGYYTYSSSYINSVPLPKNLFELDNAYIIKLTQLVSTQIKSFESLEKEVSNSKKQLIQKQINATDEEINKLVYELYGLNEKEIGVIEGKV